MAESIVTCEDNMVMMSRYPDKFFDLAIVDPPYGIGESGEKSQSRRVSSDKWKSPKKSSYKHGGWDNATPNDEYFKELKRVSKNQIIWGANHFGFMDPSSGWIVWFKKRLDEVNDFSDAELAYSSFKKGVRLFHLPWIGFGAVNAKEDRIHPTQKPVKLYKWILQNYAKSGEKILDTHVGSQSSRIAAYDLSFDYWGCELDPDYFKEGCKRFNEHVKQLQLFHNPTIQEIGIKK